MPTSDLVSSHRKGKQHFCSLPSLSRQKKIPNTKTKLFFSFSEKSKKDCLCEGKWKKLFHSRFVVKLPLLSFAPILLYNSVTEIYLNKHFQGREGEGDEHCTWNKQGHIQLMFHLLCVVFYTFHYFCVFISGTAFILYHFLSRIHFVLIPWLDLMWRIREYSDDTEKFCTFLLLLLLLFLHCHFSAWLCSVFGYFSPRFHFLLFSGLVQAK